MLKPLSNRVILEIVKEEQKSAGGLVLPDSAKEKPQMAKVIAVGEGRILENGQKVAVGVKEGETVFFEKYAGSEVKYEGTEYLVVKESDIIAVVE